MGSTPGTATTASPAVRSNRLLPVVPTETILPDMRGVTLMKTGQRTALASLAILVLWGAHVAAADIYDKDPVKTDDVVLPKPAEVVSLASSSTKIALKGLDDAQQLI